MDNCVVCLTANADLFARINFDSSEWQECNIQNIIEKHLWWWYIKQAPTDNMLWICRQCWQELSSFHNFYIKVEKIHQQYVHMSWSGYKDEEEKYSKMFVKDEFKISDNNISTLNEDLVPMSKYIRERQEENSKLPNFSESIEINELPTVAMVKDEDDISSVENILQNPNSEIVKDEKNDYIDNGSIENFWEPHINIDNRLSDSENQCKKIKKSLKERKTAKTKSKIKKIPIKSRKTEKDQTSDSLAKLEITRKNDEYLAQSEYKLFCHLCNIPLTDFLNLKTHYRVEHKIPGYAICCNKKFYNRGPLADHLRVHENPNYFKCPLCGRILAHRMSFENHIEFHKQSSGTRERIFSCDKCDKSFFKKAVYDRHILSHVPDEERKFQCDECSKKFAAEYLVTQHKAFAHLNKYGKICDICGKSFRERFSFMRHMDEHNGAPPSKVPCDICGVELTSKYLLNRHKKKMHTEENQQEQICPYCSKISPNTHAHRQHINYAHMMKRKHACHMCEKKFKRPQELKEHLSTHTGEPLYTCPHCPRTFISSANMHKHRKTAHPKEWQDARLKKLTIQKFRDMSTKEHLKSIANANIITSNALENSTDKLVLC